MVEFYKNPLQRDCMASIPKTMKCLIIGSQRIIVDGVELLKEPFRGLFNDERPFTLTKVMMKYGSIY